MKVSSQPTKYIPPKTLSSSEVQNKFGSIADWVIKNQSEVVVENYGQPTVVIMRYDEYEETRRLRALERIRAIRQRVSARFADKSEQEIEEIAASVSNAAIESLEKKGVIRFERHT